MSIIRIFAKMRQQTPIKKCLCTLDLKFFKHPRRNSFTDVNYGISLVIISPAFSNDGSSSSWMMPFNDTAFAMSLSDSKPNALTKVINGMSTGEPGIFATIDPSGRSISSVLLDNPLLRNTL